MVILNYYLSIIKSCKDISDSDQKVGLDGKCEIIYLHFIKYDNFIVIITGCENT